MQNITITPVAKEDIPKLTFVDHEVLPGLEFIERRKHLLFQCMILGNTYHAKVKIVFETTEGFFQVDTTVWATTDEFVLLKGGVYLPIRCIQEVLIP
jgi:hypothetical protein